MIQLTNLAIKSTAHLSISDDTQLSIRLIGSGEVLDEAKLTSKEALGVGYIWKIQGIFEFDPKNYNQTEIKVIAVNNEMNELIGTGILDKETLLKTINKGSPPQAAGINMEADSKITLEFTADVAEIPSKASGFRPLSLLQKIQALRKSSSTQNHQDLLDFYNQILLEEDINLRIKMLVLLADLHMRYYQESKNLIDLDQAILILEEAQAISSNNHELISMLLNDLANALFARFKKLGTMGDLHRSIIVQEKALNLVKASEKPLYLNHLVGLFVERFEQLGQRDDIDTAVSLSQEAIRDVPQESSEKPAHMNNLGNTYLRRFRYLGDTNDLSSAIKLFEEAIELTPDNNPDKSSRLNGLANSLLSRFKRMGNESDIERAIDIAESAVTLCPDNHPNKPLYLNGLATMLHTSHETFDKIEDLKKAIDFYQKADKLSLSEDSNKPMYANNLGTSLLALFEDKNEIEVFERALSMFQKSIDLLPQGHPSRPRYIYNMGGAFVSKFYFFEDPKDIRKGISIREDALALLPEEHIDRAEYLYALGSAYIQEFEISMNLESIQRAVIYLKQATQLLPNDHPKKNRYCDSLGGALLHQFKCLGQKDDIIKSIEMREHSVKLTPPGHHNRALHVNHLGNSMLGRYEFFGGIDDVGKSIPLFQEAINATFDGHPDKPMFLNNLGTAYQHYFEQLGDVNKLQQCIDCFEEAVRLTPYFLPAKSGYLTNLGTVLSTKFQVFGKLSDINAAISSIQEAVNLASKENLNKCSYMNALGKAYLHRYEQSGDIIDLDQSISLQRDAVQLTPDNHQDKLMHLSDLGLSYGGRFELFGNIEDIQNSVEILQESLRICPENHPSRRTLLNNLGNSYMNMYRLSRKVNDIEKAIELVRNAIRTTPDAHADKATYLKSLGNLLVIQYDEKGMIKDIDEAISCYHQSIALVDKSHLSHQISTQNNLAVAFAIKFKHTQDVEDLLKAISAGEDVIKLTPDENSSKPSYLHSLGNRLHLLYDKTNSIPALQKALAHVSKGALLQVGPPIDRFQAAQAWVQCASLLDDPSVIEAGSVSVELLPQLAWMGLPMKAQHNELIKAKGGWIRHLVSEVIGKQNDLAIEWLEQGRSIVWSHLLHLQNPVQELASVEPILANKLKQVSTALQKSISNSDYQHASTVKEKGTIEKDSERHRQLALEWDSLVKTIRSTVPNFHRFLLPDEFKQLRSAAKYGTVVIINVNNWSCDALVLRPDNDTALHIPLPDFTEQEAVKWQNVLSNLIAKSGRSIEQTHTERAGRPWLGAQRKEDDHDSDALEYILAGLWDRVIRPIVEALKLPVVSDNERPRIWWCPSGSLTFLPIHASGIYGKSGSLGTKLTDFVVSSYTPTLNALINIEKSIQNRDETTSNFRMLAVSQESATGYQPLPGTREELARVRACMGKMPISSLSDSEATVENVLREISSSNWAHFACHGVQDIENPTDSGLILANGDLLKLSEIINLSLPNADLAFLSACQTATGAEDLTEEAIHLAAGMLLAGYKGIVATMWSITDSDAPQVAENFYKQLFKDGVPDPRNAARALDHAVEKLRDSGAPYLSWVPFIHIGI
ncbi:CHAT domain-containing protein [Crucibulum laeve]|uniref:CHAT domain-containing protein n=1 Tax=Crucibulum laeve TaxID=68775 RepID=A0A5C3ML61_9AGAR|nr:CHAT domain-containing protein [Crucibulum laeve]